MDFAILRIQKLKSPVAVQRSMKHAYREQETPNADPALLSENSYIGPQSVDEGMAEFNARLPAKFRKDAVLAIEYLVTGSPEAVNGKDRPAQDAYFADALAWLHKRHGAENVVSAGIHRDETTPHLYAIVVPRDGERLNAKRWLGAANALGRMQSEFAATVGLKHGLQRGVENSKAVHTSIRQFYTELQAGQRLAEQQGSITPGDLVPQRSKAEGMMGRLVLAAIVERPEDVAARLTERVRPLALQVGQLQRENTQLRAEIVQLCKQNSGLRKGLASLGQMVKGLVGTQLAKLMAMADQFRQDNERDSAAEREAKEAIQRATKLKQEQDRTDEEVRKFAEKLRAKVPAEHAGAIREFELLANYRGKKMQGYDDAGAHWQRLPEPLRKRIDEYNGLPDAGKAAVRATPENIKELLDQRKSRGLSR
jgi:hypothetical protein